MAPLLWRRLIMDDDALIASLDNLITTGILVADGTTGHTAWIVGVVNVVQFINISCCLSGAGATLLNEDALLVGIAHLFARPRFICHSAPAFYGERQNYISQYNIKP